MAYKHMADHIKQALALFSALIAHVFELITVNCELQTVLMGETPIDILFSLDTLDN